MYRKALGYLGDAIVTIDHSLIYGALMLQGFIAAALVAALLCFPLANVFRQHASYAALIVSLPVLQMRIPELLDSSRHAFSLLISVYEVFTYALLIILGTWSAHKQLTLRDRL